MRHLFVLLGAAIVLSAVPALALPDYATHTWYYDENGNEVGSFYLSCSGWSSSSGVTTDSYVMVATQQCQNAEPIVCSDVGLTTINSCPSSNWCVSDGYAISYGNDVVPDCQGVCLCGEGTVDPTGRCNMLGPNCGAAWHPRVTKRKWLIPPMQRALFHYTILDRKRTKRQTF